ncbi:MAG: hypothetical protein Q8T03_06590 [Bacteroidota bacterium]|nr:hypothetical protein [Bacteroidota bacterium]MDP3557025.1 hypothetical protein [Bacteroidota bacterium]
MNKENKITIDSIKSTINRLSLSDKLNKSQYDGHFYNHLSHLMKFYFLSHLNDKKRQKFKLTERNYHSIEQSIFENPNVVEADNIQSVDWAMVDDAKVIFKNKIQKLLKNEGTSEHLKPIVKCTVDAYEYWLTYSLYFPKSQNNPWIATSNIINNGYLFLVSDNRDVIDQYQKKIYNKVDNNTKGNIGIIAKSSKNDFSGFLVDERVSVQALVLNYLKTHGNGLSNAKNINQIVKHLSEHNNLNSSHLYIKNFVNLPLKRAGIIGSTNSGYYFIDSYEDLLFTYKNHVEKRDAIERTINTFIKKGRDMGHPNFPIKD